MVSETCEEYNMGYNDYSMFVLNMYALAAELYLIYSEETVFLPSVLGTNVLWLTD